MKKELSLVFPIYEDKQTNKFWILLGKQAPGKKLAGFRNGFGGKCEQKPDGTMETTLECARRELKEELDLEIEEVKIEKCGYFTNGDRLIDCFVIRFKEKIEPPADNSEFQDTKWFDLGEPEKFVGEMLSQADKEMEGLTKFLQTGELFGFDKSMNTELQNQVKNVFK
jgi:8-oxo-dGTP pyrophosphatase MutT (NUDIX family)